MWKQLHMVLKHLQIPCKIKLILYITLCSSLVHNINCFHSVYTSFSYFTISFEWNKILKNTGAYEGFCLEGGTICAHKRAKKNFWSPPLATLVPPLKNPFFEKILIPFLNFFCPPLPPGLILFTIKIHQKDYFFGCY